MLERFRRDRKRVVSALLTNPSEIGKNLWKILSRDEACQCRLGKGDVYGFARCPQCCNIGRLTTLQTTTVEEPFMLECGRRVGHHLMLSQFDEVNSFTKKKDLPYTITRRLLTQCQEYQACEPNINNNQKTTYIASDEFTNGALASFLLEQVLTPEELHKHIVKMETAFICGENGYYLLERPDLGSFTTLDLTGDVARGIILQLLTLLNRLCRYDFTYGKPGVAPLMFSDEPCSFRYKGVLVSCPYTLKLYDFTNAALTFKGEAGPVRVYSTNPRVEAFAKEAIHLPVIATERDGVVYYILNADTTNLFLNLRYMGVALYVHSFDFYCFFVGLMADKAFYDLVIKDEFLLSIWMALWKPEDYPIIMERIQRKHDKRTVLTSEEIVKILQHLRLRCDLVPYLMKLLTE